jgi:hypothetical protein
MIGAGVCRAPASSGKGCTKATGWTIARVNLRAGLQLGCVGLLANIFLWLWVVNLGIASGAGLYEHRIVLPQWFSRDADGRLRVNVEAMRTTDTGRRFWGFTTTIPLTLLTAANGLLGWQSGGAKREWWMCAVLIVAVERIGTFVYFIPTAIRLMRADAEPSADLEAVALRWMMLNHVRAVLTLVGWIAALRALSLSG